MRSQAVIRAIVTAAFALAVPSSGSAQARDSVPGSELSVYLMTMGQGDQVWEKYGHNAIGIRNRITNSDVVFNWGIFSFEEPGFIGRFLRGEMMYWMAGLDAAGSVAQYQMLNRTVEVQELNLSPPQRLELLNFIRWNAQEENKFYRYDYFLDNCSTRVRDALNRVLGGAIKMATDTLPTGTSYRWHALRLMAADRLTTVGVNIGLGRPTDRPITAWEEMFIPMKVRDHLRNVRVPDETGKLVPLVMSERVLFQAQREPERETPPPMLLQLGPLGLLLGAGLAWLARRRHRAAVPVALVAIVLLGVMGGLPQHQHLRLQPALAARDRGVRPGSQAASHRSRCLHAGDARGGVYRVRCDRAVPSRPPAGEHCRHRARRAHRARRRVDAS